MTENIFESRTSIKTSSIWGIRYFAGIVLEFSKRKSQHILIEPSFLRTGTKSAACGL